MTHHRTILAFARAALLGAAAWLCAGRSAHATDLLGPYVGGAFGQGRIDTGALGVVTSAGSVSTGKFAENHSAYKLMAGVRPISVIGVEVSYIDFGRPRRSFSSSSVIGSADVKMSGAAAFGVLYLLPVPVLDVYVKAGLARLQATSSVSVILPGVGTCTIGSPNCAVFSQRNSAANTGAAAGAGVQVKLAAWAVRAEYERFSAAGGTPALASLGLTWSF